MRHFFIFIVLNFLFVFSYAQSKPDTIFRQPLDLPVLLSGTFAELRSDHLHSGIDFRTQGTAGHKVFACEDGYVSRIAISPGGYGRALYINHPNGYTTVYAHLDKFNDEIETYVKQQQYRRERFQVDLYPDVTRFVVKRGEIIGFSGNTGGSSGPHLHFEVRETKTEKTVNPLLFGFGVKDNVAPIMRSLAIYLIGEGSTINGSADKLILPLEKSGRNYKISGNKKLVIKGKVAFGIDVYDQTYGSANRCGPYGVSLRMDNTEIFSFTMDKFSFDETRYVNSLIDYGYYVDNKVRFTRLYMETNNQLSIYDRNVNRGIVSFADSSEHKAQVAARDVHGNSTKLDFSFSYLPETPIITTPSLYMPELTVIPERLDNAYGKDFIFQQQGIRVLIPANTLYDDILFTCSVSKKSKSLYSEVYHVHDIHTPLHRAMTIEITADSLSERLRSKALLAQVDRNGKLTSAGGTYQNGMVGTTSRSFGNFAITVDTVPPTITPINISKGINMRGKENIRFKIQDNFSGISTYDGWIDGKWVLFEYDAKNNLIYYNFDDSRLSKNIKHTLHMKITDAKGNLTEYKTEFVW